MAGVAFKLAENALADGQLDTSEVTLTKTYWTTDNKVDYKNSATDGIYDGIQVSERGSGQVITYKFDDTHYYAFLLDTTTGEIVVPEGDVTVGGITFGTSGIAFSADGKEGNYRAIEATVNGNTFTGITTTASEDLNNGITQLEVDYTAKNGKLILTPTGGRMSFTGGTIANGTFQLTTGIDTKSGQQAGTYVDSSLEFSGYVDNTDYTKTKNGFTLSFTTPEFQEGFDNYTLAGQEVSLSLSGISAQKYVNDPNAAEDKKTYYGAVINQAQTVAIAEAAGSWAGTFTVKLGSDTYNFGTSNLTYGIFGTATYSYPTGYTKFALGTNGQYLVGDSKGNWKVATFTNTSSTGTISNAFALTNTNQTYTGATLEYNSSTKKLLFTASTSTASSKQITWTLAEDGGVEIGTRTYSATSKEWTNMTAASSWEIEDLNLSGAAAFASKLGVVGGGTNKTVTFADESAASKQDDSGDVFFVGTTTTTYKETIGGTAYTFTATYAPDKTLESITVNGGDFSNKAGENDGSNVIFTTTGKTLTLTGVNIADSTATPAVTGTSADNVATALTTNATDIALATAGSAAAGTAAQTYEIDVETLTGITGAKLTVTTDAAGKLQSVVSLTDTADTTYYLGTAAASSGLTAGSITAVTGAATMNASSIDVSFWSGNATVTNAAVTKIISFGSLSTNTTVASSKISNLAFSEASTTASASITATLDDNDKTVNVADNESSPQVSLDKQFIATIDGVEFTFELNDALTQIAKISASGYNGTSAATTSDGAASLNTSAKTVTLYKNNSGGTTYVFTVPDALSSALNSNASSPTEIDLTKIKSLITSIAKTSTKTADTGTATAGDLTVKVAVGDYTAVMKYVTDAWTINDVYKTDTPATSLKKSASDTIAASGTVSAVVDGTSITFYTSTGTSARADAGTKGNAYTVKYAAVGDDGNKGTADDTFTVSTITNAVTFVAAAGTNPATAVTDGYFVIETGSGDYLALISDGTDITGAYYLKDKPKATDATPTKNTSTVAHKAGTINYSGGTIALVAYDGDTSASASTKIVSSGTVENFEAATSITYTGDVNGTTPTELANAMVGLTENLHGDTKKGTATAFFGAEAKAGSDDTKYTYVLEAKSLSTSDISQETLTAIVKATTRTVGYDDGSNSGSLKYSIDGTFTQSSANGLSLATGNAVVEINVGSTKYYAVGAWATTPIEGETLGDTTDPAYAFTPVALINEAGILVTDKSEGLYYKGGKIYAGDDNEITIKHSLEDDMTTEKAIEILAVANATDPEVTLTLEDGKISDVTNDVFQNAEILGTNFEDYSKAVSAAGTTVSKSTDEATWRTKIQGTAIVNKYNNATNYEAALAGGAAAITYSSSDESGYTGVIALGTDATPNGGLAIIDGSGTSIANLYASFEMSSSDVSTFKLTGLYTDSAATSDKAARGTTTTSSTLSHLTIKYPCNYLFYMVQCHQYIVILNEATKKGDCGHFVRVL